MNAATQTIAVKEGQTYTARNTDDANCSFVDVGAVRYELDPASHKGARRSFIVPFGVTEATLGHRVELRADEAPPA